MLKSERCSTGYKNVFGKTKPYQAQVRLGGKMVALGYFATAEEAALSYARASAAPAAAPHSSCSSLRKREVKSEERPPDMPANACVKLEEQPPPMPSNVFVKLEF